MMQVIVATHLSKLNSLSLSLSLSLSTLTHTHTVHDVPDMFNTIHNPVYSVDTLDGSSTFSRNGLPWKQKVNEEPCPLYEDLDLTGNITDYSYNVH